MNTAWRFIYLNIGVACIGLLCGVIAVIFGIPGAWLYRICVAVFFVGIFFAAAMAGMTVSLLLDKYPIGKL